jgi:phosphatidylglycerophosphate synthase
MRLKEEFLKENERRSRNIFVLLFRYIGSNVAFFMRNTNLSPNHLSIFSLAFSILAAFLLSRAGYWCFVIGAVFYQLAVVLDYSDGSLARLKGMSSFLGKWLDYNFDIVREFLIILGLCWGLHRQNGVPVIWMAGIVLCSTNFICDIMSMTFKKFAFAEKEGSSLGSKNRLYALIRHFVNARALRYFSMPLFAITNQLFFYLIFFSTYNFFVALGMAFALGRIIGRQDKLGISTRGHGRLEP